MPEVSHLDNQEHPVVLELKNITQSYGANTIIKDLNFCIRDRPNQGQFRVILGPSGCGKSHILRWLAGLQQPTVGEVFIGNRPRNEHDRVGMVFQKYSSLPWLTVEENVGLGLKLKGVSTKERKEKVAEMLALVGLEEHAKKYAQYPSLSGGQLQRVAIARSLAASSNILLMDEPFGALDVRTRLQMQDLLLSIWNKIHASGVDPTIVFVTHDIPEAVYLADVIYIMGEKPAKIIERIPVPFCFTRDSTIKKSPEFLNLVQRIEQRMMQ